MRLPEINAQRGRDTLSAPAGKYNEEDPLLRRHSKTIQRRREIEAELRKEFAFPEELPDALGARHQRQAAPFSVNPPPVPKPKASKTPLPPIPRLSEEKVPSRGKWGDVQGGAGAPGGHRSLEYSADEGFAASPVPSSRLSTPELAPGRPPKNPSSPGPEIPSRPASTVSMASRQDRPHSWRSKAHQDQEGSATREPSLASPQDSPPGRSHSVPPGERLRNWERPADADKASWRTPSNGVPVPPPRGARQSTPRRKPPQAAPTPPPADEAREPEKPWMAKARELEELAREHKLRRELQQNGAPKEDTPAERLAKARQEQRRQSDESSKRYSERMTQERERELAEEARRSESARHEARRKAELERLKERSKEEERRFAEEKEKELRHMQREKEEAESRRRSQEKWEKSLRRKLAQEEKMMEENRHRDQEEYELREQQQRVEREAEEARRRAEIHRQRQQDEEARREREERREARRQERHREAQRAQQQREEAQRPSPSPRHSPHPPPPQGGAPRAPPGFSPQAPPHYHARDARKEQAPPRAGSNAPRGRGFAQEGSSNRSNSLPALNQTGPLGHAKAHAMQQLLALKKLSKEDRQRGFKDLLRAWHPDKNPSNVEVAKEVFQLLQAERGRVLG